jgi:hypothetical protein
MNARHERFSINRSGTKVRLTLLRIFSAACIRDTAALIPL